LADHDAIVVGARQRRLIDETLGTGLHSWRIALIHPAACHGVLTELVQN